MRTTKTCTVFLFLGAFLFFGAGSVKASTAFDLQLAPADPGAGGFLVVSAPFLHNHLEYSFGFASNYGYRPLELSIRNADSGNEISATLVEHRLELALSGVLGLWGIADLGVVLPLLLQSGFDAEAVGASGVDLGTTSISGLEVGNLYLYPRFQLLEFFNGGFRASVLSLITLPLGDKTGFVHEAGVVFEPRLVIGGRTNTMVFSGYLGYRHRFAGPQTIGPLSIENEITVGAGIGTDITTDFQVYSEAYAKFPSSVFQRDGVAFSTAIEKGLSPAEWLLGGRYFIASQASVHMGLGFGISTGYGSSTPRFILGVQYGLGQRNEGDIDGDSILDNYDECPQIPEDLDGFQDTDGCPEGDNDQDKILDEDDSCPNEPEDRDGFGDEDGCPEDDNDDDGIADEIDQCPRDPEDVDSFEDDDGCPELDNDSDVIADLVDDCPNQAEDMDGFRDTDGCPDLDNDQDGFEDLSDLCPNAPEDRDGYDDDDGCPDDDDSDGIPDKWDQCPREPETYNLKMDGDGCPDPGRSLVIINEDSLALKRPLRFKGKTALLRRGAKRLLLQIASVLRNYRHFNKVIIEAHSIVMRTEAKNLELSQLRAQAIREFLVAEGIHPSRLVAEGVGSSRPLTRSSQARMRNERIEWIIDVKTTIGFGYETQSGEKPLFEIGPDDGPAEDNDIEFNF